MAWWHSQTLEAEEAAAQVTVRLCLQIAVQTVSAARAAEEARLPHTTVQLGAQAAAAALGHAECVAIQLVHRVADVAATLVTHTKQDRAATAAQVAHVAIQANHGQTVKPAVIAVAAYSVAAAAAAAHQELVAGADLA